MEGLGGIDFCHYCGTVRKLLFKGLWRNVHVLPTYTSGYFQSHSGS